MPTRTRILHYPAVSLSSKKLLDSTQAGCSRSMTCIAIPDLGSSAPEHSSPPKLQAPTQSKDLHTSLTTPSPCSVSLSQHVPAPTHTPHCGLQVSPFDLRDSLGRKMPPTPFDHRASPGLLGPQLPPSAVPETDLSVSCPSKVSQAIQGHAAAPSAFTPVEPQPSGADCTSCQIPCLHASMLLPASLGRELAASSKAKHARSISALLPHTHIHTTHP